MLSTPTFAHRHRPKARTAALFATLLLSLPAKAQLSDYVNPLRGSNSSIGYSRGNTFPGVTLPFGFNFWTPVTSSNSHSWIFDYNANAIEGFAVSHEPSPWIGDHGAFQLMPMIGELKTGGSERRTSYSHANEIARAYYYSVVLDNGIRTEFTPTDHAVIFKFTFPAAEEAHILFDTEDEVGAGNPVQGDVTIDQEARTIRGHVDHRGPRIYFHAEVSKSIASVYDGTNATAAIGFSTSASEEVILKLGTSFISLDQAEANLEQELGSKSFSQIRDQAQQVWDETLGKIEVEGATEDLKVTFYSNLYRAFMYPNSMWENVDGSPQYFSPYNHSLQSGKIYVNNGFWDTFRSAWPLYILLVPSQTAEMLQGFVNAYEDGGWTPRWTGPGYIDIMVGTHPDIVFADAYMKGIRDFDIATAYESMLKNAMVYSSNGARGRKGNQVSIFKGYIPTDVLSESAAWYLEDVINDFGIARVAEELGDTENARYFDNRALNYVNLFSHSVGFFRGRQSNGEFRTPDADFKPNEWGYEFTEGCPWHYVTAANNDPQGMANLYGGRAGLAAKIDAVFAASRDYLVGSYGGVIHEMLEAYDTNMGQYAHANEPIHHMIYMYNYAGAPAKTQARVRAVLDPDSGIYGPGYDGGGYLGDEDNGQMSSWFVFSALGFYPSSPGRPEYAIGSPLFTKATIHLENGNQFVIVAPNNSDTNIYIQRASLNGAPHTRNYLTHAEILAGGTLELVMGDSPSNWGSTPEDVPSSTTQTQRIPVPMFDRALGGTATASSENAAAGEGIAQAFDDTSETKWLAEANHAAVTYQFGQGYAHTVSLYTLTSGNDAANRDPKSWTLSGSNDGETWTPLDTRSDEAFEWRRHTRVFAAENDTPYRYYQLEITENHGAPLTQLSEIELLGNAPIEAVSTSGSAGCAPNEGPEKASDGNRHSKWCANHTLPELTVDLGARHAVNQFFLLHAGAGGETAEFNPKAYRIELSLDGTTFSEVVNVTDNSSSETEHTISPVEARYVRLSYVTPTQGEESVARLYELEVYGRNTEPPPDPGTGGMGGVGGTGGNQSGGQAGSAGSAMGGAFTGGSGPLPNSNAPKENPTCGCRTAGGTPPNPPLALGLSALSLIALLRRRPSFVAAVKARPMR